MGDLNLFAILLIIFGILQIILFFKLWIMTNDVRKLTEHICFETPNISDVKKDVVDNEIKDKRKEYDPRLDAVKPGDKVESIFDGRELIVDSIKDDKFFCKTGSFSGYRYFEKNEVKYIEKGSR
ncbi:hypothetical protein [Prevotella sp. HUN102]|uniref:hypothetical protein n=1 Tax=Prevotella sp. HUN102 TaxID=1392486 RepID=UPI0005608791|nr:hypothetical protein [Prevotella sp. HUN102]